MPVEKPSLMFSARRRLFHRTRLQLLRRFRRGADAAGSFRCSARITPILFCNEQQRVHGGLPFFGIVFCLRQLGDGVCASRSVTGGFRPGTCAKAGTRRTGVVVDHPSRRYAPSRCSIIVKKILRWAMLVGDSRRAADEI
jgi:hypothetical protein